MSRLWKLAIVTLIAAPVFAAAADDDEEIYRPYSTTNFYNVSPDFDNLDSAIGMGQSAGFPIPGVPGLAIELDFLVTLFGGENSGGDGSVAGAKDHCSANPLDDSCHGNGGGGGGGNSDDERTTGTDDDFFLLGYGLFASYTTPGKFFASAKVGVNGFSTSIEEIEEEGGGLSWKAGVGYRYGESTVVQFEYFRINDLVDGIGIGLRYGFEDVF